MAATFNKETHKYIFNKHGVAVHKSIKHAPFKKQPYNIHAFIIAI